MNLRGGRIELIAAASEQHRLDCELLNSRAALVPFVHAYTLAHAQSRDGDFWCRLISGDGSLLSGGLLYVNVSRKMPWMRLARMSQASYLLREMNEHLLGEFIRESRRAIGNMVLLNVQTFAMDGERLGDDIRLLRRLGFEEDKMPRDYRTTLVLPLSGDETELRSRLSSSARRNVAQVEKAGFSVQAIRDVRFVDRLNELLRLSNNRTGGEASEVDFASIIQSAENDPATSVLLGLFHPAREGTGALVGFAHGVVGTDCAIYSVAGTDRGPDIGRAPLSYGLLWELLKWGQTLQLPWFDFGGVTAEGDVTNPLHGISEFKRKFGGSDRRVALDMTLSVSPVQSKLLEVAGRIVSKLK